MADEKGRSRLDLLRLVGDLPLTSSPAVEAFIRRESLLRGLDRDADEARRIRLIEAAAETFAIDAAPEPLPAPRTATFVSDDPIFLCGD